MALNQSFLGWRCWLVMIGAAHFATGEHVADITGDCEAVELTVLG